MVLPLGAGRQSPRSLDVRALNVPGSKVAQRRQAAQCSRAVREYLDALDAVNPLSDDVPKGPHHTQAASRTICPTGVYLAHRALAPPSTGMIAPVM